MSISSPLRPVRPFWLSPALAIGLVASIGLPAFADGPARTGEVIYKQQCASCHGTSGEGSKEYQKPLIGSRSPAQLARYIERTMPEDDPGTCVGEDARAVASYIHDAFYSKIAQARNKPPRVELARLTVRQYRNAVADLVASFRQQGTIDDKVQGLRAEYYKTSRMRRNDRVIDRVDPVVKFDFGLDGPEPGKFDPKEFAIIWQGAVLAPETGEYEFVVRTENSIKLFVNDLKRPFIDRWVKSGNDTEFRASAFLLAGRVYPIRLEYSKSKQGVEDSKDKKAKAPATKGSIALEWKLPNRPSEAIPARFLLPHGTFPESFAPSSPFPPDDRSVGYERGSSISKEWDQATTEGALEVADYVDAHLKELSGAFGDGPERAVKLRDFCVKFAERAFRRPLAAWQVEKYVDRQFARAGDPESAVKRVILLVLKSPRFLYREVDGVSDGFDVASRLSFGLWDSPPDQALRKAAAEGRLKDRAGVLKEAARMVDDPRARAKVREFFLQWLRVEQVPDLAKDPSLYPGFDASVASDLRTSLDLFLDDVIWGESSDYRQLFLADSIPLNGRLAAFYGVDLPPDSPFQKVALDSKERAGVLTHPYLLSNFAYTSTSSPIHRGVFIARSLLGRSLRPPPVAVAPLAPDLHAGLTTRERVTLQTSPNSCVTCHGMINGLGFGLERFDAIGRFRLEEKGKPVDATGIYEPPSGEIARYEGARQLAQALASSEEAHSAFVEQLFHHMIQQPIRAFGPDLSGRLRHSFAEHKFSIRSLLVEVAAASATPPPPRDPDSGFPGWPFSQER